MPRITSAFPMIAIGAIASISLAGCYSTSSALYTSGSWVTNATNFYCTAKASGVVSGNWTLTKVPGTGTYLAKSETDSNPSPILFVHTRTPGVYVLQVKMGGSYYYSSAKVSSGLISQALTATPPIVAVAKAHSVTISGDRYSLDLAGSPRDERAFLRAIADTGATPLIECVPK